MTIKSKCNAENNTPSIIVRGFITEQPDLELLTPSLRVFIITDSEQPTSREQ
jgi:hypothetical protein